MPALVPDPGVTVSHEASSAVVQLRVPPPVLATASVLAAGVAPPAVAVNARLDGVTDSAGGTGAVTVSVTGIDAGEPVAPVAETVMVAV